MHQLLLRLRIERDCAHERRYHRKIRGRLAQAIDGSPYDHARDTNTAPFAFSEPMPYRNEHEAGDELRLLVSTPSVGVLKAIAQDLHDDPEVTAGSMVMETRAATPIETDVGPPGSSGTITTASGACISVSDDRQTYWTDREHTVGEFRDALQQTIHGIIENESGVEPVEYDPFDEYHRNKTYGVEIEVTPANDLTLVASKWDFGYEVRDEHHREVLNALLGTGIGAKRSYGFGCLQTREAGYRMEGRNPAEATADG